MALMAVVKYATTSLVDTTVYDQDKWTGGTLMKRRADATPMYVGPITPAVFRPVEASVPIPGIYPHVIQWSSTTDWVFLADNAAAAATRRVVLYTFDRNTSAVGWRGFIQLTYPTTTVHTIRSLRMTYDLYTTGTVTSSAANVTGTGTLWVTDRMCAGSRIGFGSTNPTAISTWYEIASISGETSLILTTSPGNLTDTPYVIEDLRAITVNTNATPANGGVYITKGLRYENFQATGTTIAAAITTDNARAVYWLGDAATNSNNFAAGCGLEAKSSWISQTMYVLDLAAAGNYKVYKYNIRKALTVASGRDVTTLYYATASQTFTGTGSQTNNSRWTTLSHGPASSLAALYFVSTTRIMCAKETSIVSSSTTWIDYTMTEVPPGGTATFASTGALASVEAMGTLDRLYVATTGATGFRSYITKFNNTGDPMDHIITADDKQTDQGTAALSEIAPHASTMSVMQTPWSEGGLLYLFGVGTTTITNMGHVFPVGADWQYAATTNQRLITPRFTLTNCSKADRVAVIRDAIIGGVNLGQPAEPFRMYYRTTGISDNSGAWTLITDGNDLSGAGSAAEIQFCIEFKVIGDSCLPARIFAVVCTYEDLSTDSHYQPSVANSDVGSKYFAWRFSTAFGGTVPTLTITLYDAVLGTTLLTDDTVSAASGTWEKSTNGGGAWVAYNTTDKANDETYIRYQPTSLADNIRVRALLTQ